MKKISLFDFSVLLIIFIGLFNTSQFGATLSWILVPVLLIFINMIFFDRTLRLLPMHLIAIIFWLICTFSTVVSAVVTVQRDVITFLVFVMLFMLITGNTKSFLNNKLYIKAYVLVGLLGVANILFNFITKDFYNPWYHRATVEFMGVHRDPNYVGAFLAPLPIIIVYLTSTQQIKKKWISALCITLTFAALIVDGSRGAIVSACLPLVLYYVFQLKSVKKKILIMLSGIIVLVIGWNVMLQYLPTQTIERLLFMQSGDTRSDLWAAALTGFLENPMIGQGLNSSTVYANAIAGNHSHNMYIDILSTSGIIGASLYLLLLFLVIKGKGRMNGQKILIAISFNLPMFFLNGFNSLTMWIPLIMCYIFSLQIDKQQNNSPVEKVLVR